MMPPPIPGMPPNADPNAPPDDGGMGAMVQQMSSMSPLANIDTAMAFQTQMRNLDAQVRSVAKQFPAFAPFAEQIMAKLMEAQTVVASTMREPEGPVPSTF